MAFLNHTPNGHKIVVNHINFNRKDNRLENLELTTQRKNSNKKHLKSTSKYTGVSWDVGNKKWKVQIQIKGKQTHLGRFINEKDAHECYAERLKKLKKM